MARRPNTGTIVITKTETPIAAKVASTLQSATGRTPAGSSTSAPFATATIDDVPR
jgi:hypothetical protein